MMNGNKILNVYDFDGTVTRRDSLPLFLQYCFGLPRMVAAFAMFSPRLLLMKLGLIPSGSLKERLFCHFFKGMLVEQFKTRCAEFAQANSSILRPLAMREIETQLARGEEVTIVTASIDLWVRPFFPDSRIRVIGTQVEARDGVLTGRFATPNCRGKEKVTRLRQEFPLDGYDRIAAYGDSSGDRELLAIAHTSHFKPFR